ncbi:MAG: hypothetical protein PWQ14_1234, partial [Rikenellaceae bacterium]|nr:hypothetical protein [Rikenellaceae bacterium]
INYCGSSSGGRASASQAEGRGFESRLPLLCYYEDFIKTTSRSFTPYCLYFN